MTEFEQLLIKLQNASRGNFVLNHQQRKILLKGIQDLQKVEKGA